MYHRIIMLFIKQYIRHLFLDMLSQNLLLIPISKGIRLADGTMVGRMIQIMVIVYSFMVLELEYIMLVI